MREVKSKTMTVFVLQEITKTEKEAKALLQTARDERRDCLGGRIYPPPRPRHKRWVVQTYYVDRGGRPPQGMARLTVPKESAAVEEYGIKAAS